jgi:hypothetical protein
LRYWLLLVWLTVWRCLPTDTDIKSIKVVLGGVGFNATNDKLILDTDITLSGNIAATNKVIGTVADFVYRIQHTIYLHLIYCLDWHN